METKEKYPEPYDKCTECESINQEMHQVYEDMCKPCGDHQETIDHHFATVELPIIEIKLSTLS